MALEYLLVGGLAVVTGLGAIAFGLAFRDLGAFSADGGFVLKWLLHPLVIAGMALGVLTRVLYYVLLKFYNISQVALLSALGLVATLLLARMVLGDRLAAPEWAGGVLIIVGAALIGR